jgi:hypothetical protein
MKWLKSIKKEAFFLLVTSVAFFAVLPVWIGYAYGGDVAKESAGIQLIAPAYVAELFFNILKIAFSLVATWVVIKISFPSVDDYLEERQFKSDFEKLSSFQRVAAVLAVVLVLFLGISLVVL